MRIRLVLQELSLPTQLLLGMLLFVSLPLLLVLWLLAEPIKYVFYALLNVIVVLMYLLLTGTVVKIKGVCRLPLKTAGLPHLLLVVLAMCMAIPSPSFGPLRAVASVIASTLLAGWAVLSLLGLLNRFSMLESVVLSFCSGYSVTAFVAFVLIMIGAGPSAPYVLSLLYALLGATAYATTIASPKQHRVDVRSFSNANDPFLLLALVSVLTSILVAMYPDFALLPGTDITRHYMWSRVLFRSPEIYYQYSYLWFHVYLGSVFATAGSYLETQTALAGLVIVAIPAFYVLMKETLHTIDNRLPAVTTTLFVLFSGLGWISFVYLKLMNPGQTEFQLLLTSSEASYRSTMYAQGLWPTGLTPLVVSFVIFLSLLLLMMKGVKGMFSTLLVAFLLSSAVLTHVAEAVFLAIFASIYFILRPDAKAGGPFLGSLALGFTFSIATYWVASSAIPLSNWFIIIGPLLAVEALVVISYARVKLYHGQIAGQIPHVLSSIASTGIFFAMILGLLVWIFTARSFRLSLVDEIGYVPWYFYPVMLGVVGFLACFGVHDLSAKAGSRMAGFFATLAIMGIALGRITSYFNEYILGVWYREIRVVTFVVVGLVPFAGQGFLRLCGALGGVKYMRSQRVMIAILLTTLLVGMGSAGTLLAGETWTYQVGRAISPDEWTALRFLADYFERNPHATVATITQYSYDAVALAGPPRRLFKNNVFYTSQRPELTGHILWSTSQEGPMILYVHSRDEVYLENTFPRSYLLRHLQQTANVLYKNSLVTIYELSRVAAPTFDDNTVLVFPFSEQLPERYSFVNDLLGRGQYHYSVRFDTDPRIFDAQTAILSYDPPEDGTRIANPRAGYSQLDYLTYVASGHDLIVINSEGHGFFAGLLFVSDNRTFSISRIEGRGTIEFKNLQVDWLAVKNDTTMLSAYVADGGGTTIPFVAQKKIGNGTLSYVNFYPILASGRIRSTAGEVVANLLRVGGIDLPLLRGVQNDFQGTVRALRGSGDVTVETPSVLFSAPPFTEWKITSSKGELVLTPLTIKLFGVDFVRIHINDLATLPGLGLYSRLELSGPVTVELQGHPVSLEMTLISHDSISTMRVTDAKVVLAFASEGVIVYARTPSILISGTASFDTVYFDDESLYARTRTYGQNLTIRGATSLSVYYSDVYSILGKVEFLGEIARSPPILGWDDLETLPYLAIASIVALPLTLIFHRTSFRKSGANSDSGSAQEPSCNAKRPAVPSELQDKTRRNQPSS